MDTLALGSDEADLFLLSVELAQSGCCQSHTNMADRKQHQLSSKRIDAVDGTCSFIIEYTSSY
jgi:hypothetical protein